MATIQREMREKRGLFGKLIKVFFIVFNLLMLLWLLSYCAQVGGLMNTGNEYERAGAAIGATFATSLLLFIWAAGAIVLGLLTYFTRGRRYFVTEEQP